MERSAREGSRIYAGCWRGDTRRGATCEFFRSSLGHPGWLQFASPRLLAVFYGPLESKGGLVKASGLMAAAGEGIREGATNRETYAFLDFVWDVQNGSWMLL